MMVTRRWKSSLAQRRDGMHCDTPCGRMAISEKCSESLTHPTRPIAFLVRLGVIALPIRGKLFGENSQKVVVRDGKGKPAALSGYTQGRSAILDVDGSVIFEGRYYDTRTYQALTGDDALTPTGIGICDHCINGFGRGDYAGHAFSLGVHLTREHEPAFRGEARGRID
jgi:hypothetical protein